LAFWLAKAGIDVTIVEKAPQLLATGQNIDISGSARRVIDRMGLTDQVKARNTTEQGTQFIGPDGKPFALLPLKEGAASPTSEFEILRGDLSSILYDATRNNPRIKYLFDTVIEEVLENSDRCVRVKLSNGDIQEYDVLCAADGQWSKVRKMCFPSSSVTVVDKGLYCAYWTCPRTSHDNRYWNIYVELGSRGVNLRPDPYGTMRACVTRMPLDEAHKNSWESASRADRASKISFLKKEFSDAGWETRRLLDGLDNASDFYFQAVKQIKMKSWSQGRVVCLGDTAYAPTPLTGTGRSHTLPANRS
jgi:2-polyprenyl-6-methoxyphenol hydroxylase-like FAD-dependent oxidoreductase